MANAADENAPERVPAQPQPAPDQPGEQPVDQLEKHKKELVNMTRVGTIETKDDRYYY